MPESKEILKSLRERQKEIFERFSVKKIGLFGSVIRGGDRESGDIDILVELGSPTFDNYMDLKFFLEKLFSCQVDLVLAETVKPRLKPIIFKEVVYA